IVLPGERQTRPGRRLLDVGSWHAASAYDRTERLVPARGETAMQVAQHLRVKTGRDLARHVFSTYINLRVGMAFIAIIWPLLLWIGGKAHGIALQDSLSDYYHIEAGSSSVRTELFFGAILVGACLAVYGCFVWLIRDKHDNHALLFVI